MHLEITQSIGLWAYVILAVLVLFEGPLATLTGAVAASAGFMKPEWVFLAASLGNVTADLLWYGLGFIGKTEWLVRFGKLAGVKREQVHRLEKEVHHHAPRLLLIAKLTLGFVVPTLIATGMARVPLRRWIGYLLLGETLWTGVLVVLGFFFGHYLQQLESGLGIVAFVGSLLFFGMILYYLVRHRRQLDGS